LNRDIIKLLDLKRVVTKINPHFKVMPVFEAEYVMKSRR